MRQRPSFWTYLKRVLKAGFLNFWRNGFVTASSILMMTITLFTLGIVLFTGFILNDTLASLRSKADLSIYFVPSASISQIQSFESTLEEQPEVASVTYTSAENELLAFRERHQDDQLTLQALDELDSNPLGAVLTVKAKDLSQYDTIANFLKQQEAVGGSSSVSSIIDKVNYFDASDRAAVQDLQSITQSAWSIGLALIAVLAITTIIIFFNTIRLVIYTSREEISVMQLVGAGRTYIRAPFMVEAMLYGLFSGILTLILLYPFTWWLGRSTVNFFGGLNVFTYYLSHFGLLFVVIVGSGVVLGAIASYLAARRYLKV